MDAVDGLRHFTIAAEHVGELHSSGSLAFRFEHTGGCDQYAGAAAREVATLKRLAL